MVNPVVKIETVVDDDEDVDFTLYEDEIEESEQEDTDCCGRLINLDHIKDQMINL